MDTSTTFVLQEVIDDLINIDKSLVSPLMKLNYFGRLIKNEELIQYTSNELNGYKHGDTEVPIYRKTPANLVVDVQAYMNKHVLQVPTSMLEPPFDNLFKYIDVREGIGTIEKISEVQQKKEDNSSEFGRDIPMEMMHYIQPAVTKLYRSDARLDAVGARLLGNGNILHEILNIVRAKLLAFTMEVGEKFGYNIEISSFKKEQEKNNQTIIQYMKTEINTSGDGNIVSTGDNANIHATIKITKGDIKALQSHLETQGVDQEDIHEISEIVQNEQPDLENNRLGEKSNNWILKILGKSLNGIGKVATGISSNLLATFIKHYYGMHD